MKKLIYNGLAVVVIVSFMAVFVIADQTSTLSSGSRKLVEALLICLLYGLLWLWVKSGDFGEERDLALTKYHIQTWSSPEQIDSYLGQYPSTQIEHSLSDSSAEVELASKR